MGVFEADDDVFDDFDEENIPVIKNIYKRKKGSAEKLKTNQGIRTLLNSQLDRRTLTKLDEQRLQMKRSD